MTFLLDPLQCICSELDNYLTRRLPIVGPIVVLANLVDRANQPIASVVDKLVVSVVNIVPESAMTNATRFPQAEHRQTAVAQRINLSIVCYANFINEHYSVGLNVMAHTLAFFQNKPVFTAENTPKLPGNIGKLHVQLQAFSNSDTAETLAMLGVPYLPAAFYEIRGLMLSNEFTSSLPIVTEVVPTQ